jgi:hypothetical protein
MSNEIDFIGLNEWASKLISEATAEPYCQISGPRGEPYPLQRYRLASGEVLEEFVQSLPAWGPRRGACLALRGAEGKLRLSLWTEPEIRATLA